MKNIIALILILGSVGLFFFYIKGEYDTIGAKRAQVAQYNIALDNAAKLAAERTTQINNYNSFSQSDLARLTELLPDGVDNIKLILDINDVASRYGMSIKNISISQPDDSGGQGQIGPDSTPYGSIQFSFGVTTTYDNFLLFMKDLEKNLRLVDITALSFSSNPNSTYDFSVTLKTYWLK